MFLFIDNHFFLEVFHRLHCHVIELLIVFIESKSFEFTLDASQIFLLGFELHLLIDTILLHTLLTYFLLMPKHPNWHIFKPLVIVFIRKVEVFYCAIGVFDTLGEQLKLISHIIFHKVISVKRGPDLANLIFHVDILRVVQLSGHKSFHLVFNPNEPS